MIVRPPGEPVTITTFPLRATIVGVIEESGVLRAAMAFAFLIGLVLVLPGLVLPWLLGRFVDEVLVAKLPGVAAPLLAGLFCVGGLFRRKRVG